MIGMKVSALSSVHIGMKLEPALQATLISFDPPTCFALCEHDQVPGILHHDWCDDGLLVLYAGQLKLE